MAISRSFRHPLSIILDRSWPDSYKRWRFFPNATGKKNASTQTFWANTRKTWNKGVAMHKDSLLFCLPLGTKTKSLSILISLCRLREEIQSFRVRKSLSSGLRNLAEPLSLLFTWGSVPISVPWAPVRAAEVTADPARSHFPSPALWTTLGLGCSVSPW